MDNNFFDIAGTNEVTLCYSFVRNIPEDKEMRVEAFYSYRNKHALFYVIIADSNISATKDFIIINNEYAKHFPTYIIPEIKKYSFKKLNDKLIFIKVVQEEKSKKKKKIIPVINPKDYAEFQ